MFNFLKQLFQKNPTLGAEINIPDNRDVRLATIQKPVGLPTEFFTSLDNIAVTDQKQIGSCVGQAEGTIVALFDLLENNTSDVSRRYIYAKCKEIDGFYGQGTYPRVGASIIKNKGVPSSKIVPDDNDLPYSIYALIPDMEATSNDAKTRKATYSFPLTDKNSLKQAIIQNKLCSVTLMVDWGTFNSSGIITKPRPNYIAGAHRVTLYGFKEDRFFFRNSWGSKWGVDGNGSLDYNDYANYIYDPIVYVDVPNEILQEIKDTPYVFTRSLRFRSVGSDVKKLQERLKGFGYYSHTIDGSYGPRTKEAIRKYQISVGLFADGLFGLKTMAKINGVKITLEEAIIQVESGGNLYAIGDLNLKNKAYGCLQIRKPYIDDVNKKLGTNYKAEDCLGKKELSLTIYREYMKIYATKENIGREPTSEDIARIHNGGPSGWKNKYTVVYWSKVRKLLG